MRFKFFTNRALLVDKLEGVITLEMLLDLTRAEVVNPDFKKINRVLSDIRGAELSVSVIELHDFIMSMGNHDSKTDFRWAIVTDSPYPTALSMLLKENPAFRSIVGVFSGLTAANEFLGVRFDDSEFLEDGFLIV